MKKTSKAATTALALALLLGTVPYAVYADTVAAHTATSSAVSQEQAVAIAKKQFTIPEDYKLQSASYQSADQSPVDQANVWTLLFRAENTPGGDAIFIRIDADTGSIVSFDQSLAADNKIQDGITKEAAQAIAVQQVHRFLPDKVAQVKLIDTATHPYNSPSGADTYTFRYVRVVNGIPFPTDGVTIRLNARGELRGYSAQWNDAIQFPNSAATPTVTADQAKEAFRNSLHLQLQYQKPYTPSGVTNLKLVYAPWGFYGSYQLPTIDAMKGVAIGQDGNELDDTAPTFAPLSDQPSKPLPTEEITKEAALALIPSYNLDLTGYKLDSVNYTHTNNGTMTYNEWQVQYTKGASSNGQEIINLSINAKTGDLLNMNHFILANSGNNSIPDNPAVSKEQAKDKAIDFIKHALPSQANRLSIDPATDAIYYVNSGDYHFRFLPLIDGLPANGFGYEVSINPNTGNVQEFNSNYETVDSFKYPSKQQAITQEAALDRYVQHNPLQLMYTPVYESNASPYTKENKIKGVALVYAPFSLSGLQVVDAITGDWFSPFGAGAPTEIGDIKGHWAEKQLQYFADQGIFEVNNGKLEPNATVTRGDAMKYLILATNGPRTPHAKAHFADVPSTDPNFEYIEEVLTRKWIDSNAKTFRPSDMMTRKELSDAVVHVLGYEKLAEAPDAFKPHFADVKTSDPYFGDIAIVSNLGIMGGYDHSFSPNQPITKAQLAVVLAKVVDQLREKQGYPYYNAY